jgi:hypothetical protein
MSELINSGKEQTDFKWHLLANASMSVLIMSIVGVASPKAEEDGRPVAWIELGGQLEHMSGLGDPFVAPFMTVTPTPQPFLAASPIEAQRPSRYSVGEEGKLVLTPSHSDWVFSAQVRYGRSQSRREKVHQTDFPQTAYRSGSTYYSHPSPYISVYQPAARFAHTTVTQSQSHTVLDFMAGKDVGLGLFGRDGSSVFSVGVRYAQFSAHSRMAVRAVPSVQIYNVVANYPTFLSIFPKFYIPRSQFVQYSAFATATRSFHGVGPALSWNASVPMIGNRRAGELSFDWELNGAVLFGRQKSATSHHSTTHFRTQKYPPTPTVTHPAAHNARSRSIVVPNVGLSAAVSYRIENFKATLGYRGDFFFGAVDTGWDARRTSDLTFHGPFLNFALGL